MKTSRRYTTTLHDPSIAHNGSHSPTSIVDKIIWLNIVVRERIGVQPTSVGNDRAERSSLFGAVILNGQPKAWYWHVRKRRSPDPQAANTQLKACYTGPAYASAVWCWRNYQFMLSKKHDGFDVDENFSKPADFVYYKLITT